MGLDAGSLLVIAVIVYGVKAIADGLVVMVDLLERIRARRRRLEIVALASRF